ncbi:MAG: curli production assembly protein CsgG [Fibrobacteria bacterium]|nr:curli production assembly protein CsgG [Fibrobacteria bacterium]
MSCSSQVRQVKVNAPPPPSQTSSEPTISEFNGIKHRIAIAEFVDKSGYGSNLFGTIDDLGGQASDILNSHLIKTGEFIILERSKLGALKDENQLQSKENSFLGVTALIFGSVTEFGTKTEVQDAGISKSKVQTAHAKVTIRMVDPKTGVAFYSEFGEANAEKTVSQVFGFGSKAGYDATLTDKALNGAVTKLVGNILNTLRSRPWSAPILDIQGPQIFIGAGKRSGIKVGQVLQVLAPGKKIKNPSTGAMVELPGTIAGKIKVVSQFGTNEWDEGSVCSILEGTGFQNTYRVELKENK